MVTVHDLPAVNASLNALSGVLLLIAFACGLAWRRRALPAPGLIGTVAATWTAFLVLAPGGAVQYSIWLLFPLLMDDVRLGIAYLVAATPFIVVFYPLAFATLAGYNFYPALVALWPALDFSDPFSWTWPALILWSALVLLLGYEGRRWWRAEAPEQGTSPGAPLSIQ